PADTPVVALEDGSFSATKLCVCTRVDNERIHWINSEGGDELSGQPGCSPGRAEIIAADDSVSAGAREDRVRALRIDCYANNCSARTRQRQPALPSIRGLVNTALDGGGINCVRILRIHGDAFDNATANRNAFGDQPPAFSCIRALDYATAPRRSVNDI